VDCICMVSSQSLLRGDDDVVVACDGNAACKARSSVCTSAHPPRPRRIDDHTQRGIPRRSMLADQLTTRASNGTNSASTAADPHADI